jgi:tRNA (guanine37-N1)-methyltransferase
VVKIETAPVGSRGLNLGYTPGRFENGNGGLNVTMKIDILTLFPGMFENVLNESILKIAQKKNKITVNAHNLRGWTRDRHRTADDKPYGGGSGMVMMVEPIYEALAALLGREKIKSKKGAGKNVRVVLLTPKGRRFNQKTAKKLSTSERLVLICGHYEGIDERVSRLVTDEISVGDYILTGGEIPAMVILDAVTRLIPGVLGDKASADYETFENNLLEYPQYTRPREFKGMRVPDVLLSGDHPTIARWREKEAIKLTRKRRKDLIA